MVAVEEFRFRVGGLRLRSKDSGLGGYSGGVRVQGWVVTVEELGFRDVGIRRRERQRPR